MRRLRFLLTLILSRGIGVWCKTRVNHFQITLIPVYQDIILFASGLALNYFIFCHPVS